jgi:hypothetical protein
VTAKPKILAFAMAEEMLEDLESLPTSAWPKPVLLDQA